MKKALILIACVAMIILAFEVYYRKTHGVWNVFIPPQKIHCLGREYHASNTPGEKLAGTPLFKVKVNDLFWRGRVFADFPPGKYTPTVLYLKVGNNLYQSYSLSGGP